jgi:DNA polymerase I-like protein with 3'-5' exonuclease and polymerase domains|tara:strand:- start:9605 stop:10882 length:1278 start_codon:yes stop_codon:yes gene_type:complete
MEAFPQIPEWVTFEHQIAELLNKQEEHGWAFDERAAWELASSFRKELEETKQILRDRHPYVKGEEKTPKRNNKTQGYVLGATFTRLKELNPSSRDHISWILQTFHGWNPTKLTNTGKPIVDEITLKEAVSDGITIAGDFLKLLNITKILGMISEGANAWLKLCTKSRIHHYCSTGAATFRCSHRNPNLAQVPSNERIRALFIPTPGQVMVGADLSGVELRMLSHFLSRYDSGRYAEILLNGDIHQVNADKVGVSRSQVKTITYAFLYGAGDEKIGHSYDKLLSSKAAKKKGKEIKEAYIDAIEGLRDLLVAIKKAAERGYIKALDGRKIKVDSPHKALNFCLQGNSAILAKRWMLINHETVKSTQLCASQLAFIHDELQFECSPEHADDLCSSLVFSAAAAGEFYKLRCPIAAEAKTGTSWGETH